MNTKARQQAVETAQAVRKEYNTDSQPLQIIFSRIYKSKKISVEYKDNGELTAKKGDRWEITLPHDTSRVRDNFTIAHELGHIFLNHKLNEDNKIYRSGRSTEEEIQANLFAAEFLMPKKEFTDAASKFHNDEKKLSEMFEVSRAAALVRLNALGLDK